MFYNYQAEDNSYNECNARGACSMAPKISSLQEVLVIFLKQISFYTLKLEKLNQDITLPSDRIVSGLASIISTTDYSDEQLLDLVGMYYGLLIKTKREYQKICKQNNLTCEELKFGLKITPQMNLSGIIAQGEKIFLEKYRKLPASQKNMTEILLFTLKSVCINLLDLKNCKIFDENAVKTILTGLDSLNSPRVHIPVIKEKIKELVDVNDRLLDTISTVERESFGPIKRKSVSLSTSSGKAILVSGGSMTDLMCLLEQVQNEEIDVYTHGDLLIAHAFEKFAENKQLKGHYGNCNDKCILDFATFPGAILLTRNSYQNVEYLYRGRLFTTEDIQPAGVIKIENNDFSGLIASAKNAKGFAKGKVKESEIVGFDPEKLNQELDKISEKFNNNEIEKLLIIGPANFNTKQEDYLKTLINKLTDKTYIISFSYNTARKDLLHINVANNIPLISSILKSLFQRVSPESDRVSIIVPKCSTGDISKVLSLKAKGLKNIYLCECTQNALNPSVISTLTTVFGIKTTSDPEKDVKLL